MTEATASSHLSIGEVLSLVQEDFPDVTISKIRFLESQGLIAPERTGSGYRKFYEADIDRLRWILRQQRDHFLPLKVIKKMLDEGVDLHGGTEAQPTLWSSTETLPSSGGSSAAGSGSAEGAEADAAGGSDAAATDPGSTSDDRDEAHDDEARRSYRSPSHPAVASAGSRGRGSTTPPEPDRPAPQEPTRTEASAASTGEDAAEGSAGDAPPAREPHGAGARGEEGRAGDADAAAPDEASGSETPSSRPAHSTPADVVAALQEDPRSARRGKGRPRAADPVQEEEPATHATPAEPARRMAEFQPSPPLSSLLSAEELCELCGITPELLAGLEQFGLVVPASLGGRSAYDADAVDVARIAARYVELGVEPRHLRMYKVSAEREAGFVEQLVVPLIKQRNPAARQQASERADDLITMGAHLHAALLRRQLGRLLGP